MDEGGTGRIYDILEEIRVLRLKGMFDEALGKLKDIEDDVLSSDDQELIVRYHIRCAWVHTLLQHVGTASDHLDAARILLDENKVPEIPWMELEQRLLHVNSRLLRVKGQTEEGYELLKKAVDMDRPYDQANGMVLIDLAAVESERGNLAESVELYLKGIEILEEVNDTQELIRAYNNASDAHLKLKDYQPAYEMAMVGIVHARTGGNIFLEGFGYLNAIEALIKMGRIGDARKMINKAIPRLEAQPLQYHMALLDLQQGMLEASVDNFQYSIYAFERALKHFDNSTNYYETVQTKYEYAVVLIKVGKEEQALEQLHQAKAIIEKHNLNTNKEEILERIGELTK